MQYKNMEGMPKILVFEWTENEWYYCLVQVPSEIILFTSEELNVVFQLSFFIFSYSTWHILGKSSIMKFRYFPATIDGNLFR